MSTKTLAPTLRSLRTLLALAAVATALGAQATPVTVVVNGLPPGLSPSLVIKRNVCPDGMGWASNAAQPLTESSFTTIEPVTLPSGQTTFRSRVITRYTASFDTPATPATTEAWDRRCSTLGMSTDQFIFSVRVPGLNASDQPAEVLSQGTVTSQAGPLTLNLAMSARTASLTPAINTLSRNVAQTVDATYSASIGAVAGQRLDFLRPSPLIFGLYTRVASLFVRASDNAACVQAGATTRCLGSAGPVEAGGVLLRGLQRTVPGQQGVVRFQFELASTFPIGALKLRAAADASDLAAYLVDGTPQALDLLPWQGKDDDLTVQ